MNDEQGGNVTGPNPDDKVEGISFELPEMPKQVYGTDADQIIMDDISTKPDEPQAHPAMQHVHDRQRELLLLLNVLVYEGSITRATYVELEDLINEMRIGAGQLDEELQECQQGSDKYEPPANLYEGITKKSVGLE